MSKARKSRLLYVLCWLAEASGGRREITDMTVEVYDDALRDVPIEEIERRAREHAKAKPFFPAAAELRDAPTRGGSYALRWKRGAAKRQRETLQDLRRRLESQRAMAADTSDTAKRIAVLVGDDRLTERDAITHDG